MAEQFVGLDIAVTLSNNAQLTGTVAKVDSTTQILHLRDGKCFERFTKFAWLMVSFKLSFWQTDR